MKNLSAVKHSFLGGLTAVIAAALIFGAAAVAAQELLDPEDASETTGQNVGDEALSPLQISAPDSINGQLVVFSTVTTYTGAGPAAYGRAAMYGACQAADPASHFCSLAEIESAWKTGGVLFSISSQSWVDDAVMGTMDSGYSGDFTIVSDWYGGAAVGDFPYNCNAWTSSTNLARGLILNSGAISPAVESCDDTHPIACCK